MVKKKRKVWKIVVASLMALVGILASVILSWPTDSESSPNPPKPDVPIPPPNDVPGAPVLPPSNDVPGKPIIPPGDIPGSDAPILKPPTDGEDWTPIPPWIKELPDIDSNSINFGLDFTNDPKFDKEYTPIVFITELLKESSNKEDIDIWYRVEDNMATFNVVQGYRTKKYSYKINK